MRFLNGIVYLNNSEYGTDGSHPCDNGIDVFSGRCKVQTNFSDENECNSCNDTSLNCSESLRNVENSFYIKDGECFKIPPMQGLNKNLELICANP